MPDPSKAIEALLDEFAPGVQAVYLFGSSTSGGMRPDSDVDVALLFPHAEAQPLPGNLLRHPLRTALMRHFRREVDLVNLRRLPTVFQHEIVSNGERIVCRDSEAADEFEIGVLSRYQKLNEERAEILRDFSADGRAYAP